VTAKTKASKQTKTKERSEDQYPLIELSQIRIVERPAEGDADEPLFYNPRSMDSFTVDEMAELKDSLRQDGLQQPPIVRIFTQDGKRDGEVLKIELVAGERRLRSLQSLVEEDTPCQTDDGEKPASQVFAFIPCKVYYNIDDARALRIAFIENGQHKSLTTKEEIALVERLTKRGLKQDEISVVLGTNVTWVSQTSNFREELPPDAFARLLEGKLSRHVAVKMLSYKKEDRQPLFTEMVRVEQEERAAAKAKLQAEKEQAEDDEELAARGEQQAITQKDGGEAKRQQRKQSQARRRQGEIVEKEKKLDSEAETLRQGTLQKAGQRAGIQPKKAQILTKSMIEQFYVDLVAKWIENGKIDSITKQEMPEDKLRIIRATAQAILTGQHDPGRLMRQIMVEAGLWTLPDGYEEEPQELLEVGAGDEEIGE
jgi:ParB-like chromosome segregation protein Spo0J